MNSDRWKSEQRDWLVRQLIELKNRWMIESASKETQFSPDVNVDNVAKARTGGCARQLDGLLQELYGGEGLAIEVELSASAKQTLNGE